MRVAEGSLDFLCVTTGHDDFASNYLVPSLNHLVYHRCFKGWMRERERCFPEGLLLGQSAGSYPSVFQAAIIDSARECAFDCRINGLEDSDVNSLGHAGYYLRIKVALTCVDP